MIRCGTDIIEISRIKKAIETNEKFLNRIYTDSEILYSESKKSKKYELKLQFPSIRRKQKFDIVGSLSSLIISALIIFIS